MNQFWLNRYSWSAIAVILIMYIVGGVGFAVNPDYFVELTVYHLLVVNLMLVIPLFFELRSLLVLVVVAALGYFIEVTGVATGRVFGVYQYGEVLGLKLLGVPLIIGFNWAALLVAGYSLVAKKMKAPVLGSLVVGFLIMAIDFLIEPVAIHNLYWSWELGNIPVQNYMAWFVLSTGLCYLMYRFKIQQVPILLSAVFLVLQALFFIYIQVMFI